MKWASALFFALSLLALPVDAAEETLSFGRFGKISVYRTAAAPEHVALFVSGDGGWDQGVMDMARELATMDTLVVGVDVIRYLKALDASAEACVYPAADFEALAQFIQRHYGFQTYRPPILVGYSSGAALVYATLAQAPPGTFQGALSLDFCPGLRVSKPFCKGSGLNSRWAPQEKRLIFEPASHLQSPWIVLQNDTDPACDPPSIERFVSHVKRGSMSVLPKTGNADAVTRNGLPGFKEAFQRIAGSTPPTPSQPEATVTDLPLVEVAASGPGTDTLAIILSGDGGWTGIDKDVGKALAAKGYPVVGLNSLHYFWKARTPAGAAKDLERVLVHYLSAWKKQKALLIGYSYGADVLPFMANRLPKELADKVAITALLGPSRSVAFEFHVAEWLGAGSSSEMPVLPEVQKLKGARILCLYGDGEKDSLCKDMPAGLATIITLPGGHHFGGDYQAVAEVILKELGLTRVP